jgi:hypothetical protein
MGSMMNAKEDITLNYGKHLQIASIVYLFVLL